MNSVEQAEFSQKKYGGKVKDYFPIHYFFDQTEQHIKHDLHFLILHNSWGIFLCEEIFGPIIINSVKREVCVRDLGEQHVLNDLHIIPSVQQITSNLSIKPWMGKRIKIL